MTREFRKPNRLFGLMAALFLILPASALAAPTQPIAEVENLGDTLVFHPHVSFAELILTVTGPCDFQFRQVVTEGEPFFRLDATTIDGAYTYDLMREEPVDPGVVKLLLAARQNDDPEVPRALCRDGKLPGPPVAQSEGFLVVQGQIIYDPTAVEKGLRSPDPDAERLADVPIQSLADASIQSLAAADFVINDDLIVDGSACIGFDCVNGEVFSFDTIRLKENNLRIKFDDTSVVPSFPANDWQLTANESANGGASKFSIEDISGGRTPFTVEANARSHSLYVDDGGRIGSRTSTPSVEIHTIDGDTPTLRLQQDGSSGFEPQTWDVAGNETNFFIRDVTNGSTLPFRIRPSAPSNSIFVDVDSDVGMGTSSPDASLDVERNGQVTFRMTDSAGDAWNFTMDSTGAPNDGLSFTLVGSGSREMRLTPAGNLEVLGTISSGGTQLNVPDYVFEPDYELMPLDELAEYVKTEKHLPKVPSAGDIKAGGLNMTNMQLSLLEKVEELTLYTIAQEEIIRDLKPLLEALRHENADLAARLTALEETAVADQK